MTNIIYFRHRYRDEAGSETPSSSADDDANGGEESGAVAVSTETMNGLEAKLALLSAIRMNCFPHIESVSISRGRKGQGRIMEVVKLCEANQLQTEHVYVNGRQLCQDELAFLQSCSNPPTDLKSGRYWYDKYSGLWGEEGQKPCRIISAHLNVGGPIITDASNGNRQVFINGREITKVELWILKFASVQCPKSTHFWVGEDGSIHEEGKNNIKGNIWSKARVRLVCAVLSLPVPSKVTNPCGEEIDDLVPGAGPESGKGMPQKLLLVGYNGSGTSTIFKQAKILYKSLPFSGNELQNIKLTIQRNTYKYLGILLDGRDRFEEECLSEIKREQLLDQSDGLGSVDEGDIKTIYSISPRLKAISTWLLDVIVSGNLEAIYPAREYAPLVEELWMDAAIQATFNRKSELLMLPSVASYFLERAVNISRADYEPSNMDILYAEGITLSKGLASMDFSFPQSAQDSSIDASNQHIEPLLRYQLIRVHNRGLGENCKCMEMFQDIGIVIFCVSLSDYDQFIDDGSGVPTNKMEASRRLFESIVTSPVFYDMDFLLILNKFDLLKEKIKRVPLTQCDWFSDFNPLTNIGCSLPQLAFHYIAAKFKRHFTFLTRRKLYVSLVNGLESYTVDEALRYAREILKWDEESCNSRASTHSSLCSFEDISEGSFSLDA